MKYFGEVLALSALAASITVGVAACFPAASAEPPLRARARASILGIALGVRVADDTCAAVATSRHDVALADRCAGAYRIGRASLLLAEAALDVGDASSAACAAAPGVTALHELEEVLRSGGASVPPAVVDGVDLAGAFARLASCEPMEGGSE